MNGFQRRRELKMESILQAAGELFTAQGFKAVSVAAIAEKARVSQVSIYNFFGSKDNLARQAIFRHMNQKMSEVETLLAGELPFREKFAKLLHTKAAAAADDNCSPEFFQSIAWDDPVIQGLFREYYQTRTRPLISELIKQGKQEGYIDSNIADEAILLYMNMFAKLLSQSGLPPKVRADLGTLFFYGLPGKPPQG